MPERPWTDLCLPERYRAKVPQILRAHGPHAEVWAYGSRVNDNSYEASDLDLVVRQPADLRQANDDLWRLRQAFIDSDLPIQVQVVDWAQIPATFHDEIDAGYVIIQEAAEHASQLNGTNA